MALPLPKVVADVGPGGGIVTAMRGINALRESDLENQIKALTSKYYGPNIESEIAQRKSLTAAQDIRNQYLPQQLQLANAFHQLQNQYYTPNILSEIAQRKAQTERLGTMTPLEAERMRLQNQFYPELTRAQIESQKSLASMRELGGSQMGVPQKELLGFQKQLMIDNPNWTPEQANQAASAYLAGQTTLPTGEPLPPISGLGQTQLGQIQKRSAPVAIQNQAAQMDMLYDELSNYDIDSVKSFAGPVGKSKLAYAKLKMATNPNDPSIDPMARRFIMSMDRSIQNMDTMRKAYGTSVVPDYVYQTIGKLTNPASGIWNDATQIEMNYKDLLKATKRARDMISDKAKYGATYRREEGLEKGEEKSPGKKKWIYNQQTGKLEQ